MNIWKKELFYTTDKQSDIPKLIINLDKKDDIYTIFISSKMTNLKIIDYYPTTEISFYNDIITIGKNNESKFKIESNNNIKPFEFLITDNGQIQYKSKKDFKALELTWCCVKNIHKPTIYKN